MHRDEATQYFLGLEPRQKGLFLAQLAHDLTVAARGYYQAANQVDQPVRQTGLERLNEVQHHLSAHFRRLLGDPTAGFPDEAVMDVLFGSVDSSVAKEDLLWAIERAASLQRAEKTAPRTKAPPPA